MFNRFKRLGLVAAAFMVAVALIGFSQLPASPVLAADADGDGYSDALEGHVNTNPNDNCGINAWPPDFNNDGAVTGFDLSAVAADVGSNVPPAAVRKDIAPDNWDNAITGADISSVAGRIGTSCFQNYYIDPAGDNDNIGTSETEAWADTAPINAMTTCPNPAPPDPATCQAQAQFLFKRGETWSTPLELTTANITAVGAYGTGAQPKIDTDQADDCVTVTNAVVTTIKALHVDDCYFWGFDVSGSSTLNLTFDGVKATGNVGGMHFTAGMPMHLYTTVKNSNFTDNNRMSVNDSTPDNDSGAWGILLNGGRLWAENNHFEGHDAASMDYVQDGAAIEPFQCDSAVTFNNTIIKNRAVDNDAFIETPPCGSSTYNMNAEDNHIIGSGGRNTSFNMQQGAGSNVNIQRNTIQFSALDSGRYGVYCDAGCFFFANNIVHVAGTGARSFIATGGTVKYNLFQPGGYCPTTPCSGGNNINNVDPLNKSMTDRHLQTVDEGYPADSPAIDAGDPTHASASGITTDQDGDARPWNTQDIGADEVIN